MRTHWIGPCVSCGQATVAPFNVSSMQLLMSVYILAKLDFTWPNFLEYVIFHSKVFGDSGNISLQNIQQPPEVIRKKRNNTFPLFFRISSQMQKSCQNEGLYTPLFQNYISK